MSDTHNTSPPGDADELDADLAYLRSLVDALFEHPKASSKLGRRLSWPRGWRIEIELVEDMSVDARRAVFRAWPTFDFLWATS